MTIAEDVIKCLTFEPYKHGATATQVYHYINASKFTRPDHSQWCVRFDGQLWACHETCKADIKPKRAKLSSVSSQLAKMVKRGTLRVLPGHGPRGGNGYVLAPLVWRCGDCGLLQPDTYDSDCDGCHSNNLVYLGIDK